MVSSLGAMQNEKVVGILYTAPICAVEGMAGWGDACVGWKGILKLTLKEKTAQPGQH